MSRTQRISHWLSEITLKKIILTAVAVRIIFLICYLAGGFTENSAVNTYPDSVSYIAPADSLLQSGQFLNSSGKWETNRTPGYPLFLAFCRFIGRSHWIWAAVVFQLLFNAAGCAVLYLFVIEFCGKKDAAVAAGLLQAFNLNDISHSFFILTDSISQFLVILGLLFFLKAAKKSGTFSQYLLCLSVFVINYFVRPSEIVFPFFLILIMTILLLVQKEKRKAFNWLIAALLTACLPLLGWQLRNVKTAGYNGFSSNGPLTLYYYNSPGIIAKLDGTDYYAAQKSMSDNPALKNTGGAPYEMEKKLALDIILHHLDIEIFLILQGMALLLFYPGIFDVLRPFPSFAAQIEELKQLYIQQGLSLPMLKGLISNSCSLLILINFGLLLFLNILLIIGLIKSFKIRLNWVHQTALLGIFLYSLVVCSGPVGYGSYTRYRLSISAFQAVYFGMALIPLKQENNASEEDHSYGMD